MLQKLKHQILVHYYKVTAGKTKRAEHGHEAIPKNPSSFWSRKLRMWKRAGLLACSTDVRLLGV